MIKNEKQYRISKKRLAQIENTLTPKQSKTAPGSKEEGSINSLTRIKNDIKEEIRQFENLRKKGMRLNQKISLKQLPNILIAHKIAKGFTQKQYSEILGIKEQQLQRYEAENYSSVSFGRLLQYIEKANIKIDLAVK